MKALMLVNQALNAVFFYQVRSTPSSMSSPLTDDDHDSACTGHKRRAMVFNSSRMLWARHILRGNSEGSEGQQRQTRKSLTRPLAFT